MIISKVELLKLYGKYNYNISFNKDITLIYGMNGCGKTTILNIISSIITGKIYKLFFYNFEKISLYYIDDDKTKINESKIVVTRIDDKLRVNFNKNDYDIIEQSVPDDRRRRRTIDYIFDYYAEVYPFLLDIKHEFNYVYLALNRAAQLSDEIDNYYARKYFFRDDEIVEPEYISPEIQFVESLITKKYMDVSADVNRINNEFRNRILKKSINLQTYETEDEMLEKLLVFDDRRIKKISASYIKILEEFSLVNEKEKKEYEDFFEDCLKNEKEFQAKNKAYIFQFMLQCYDLLRIQEIVKNAEDAEKSKAEVHKPLNLFLDTVNEFISNSDIDKRIDINENGRVYFVSEGDGKKLSIQFLSSGEKQLIVFLANLVFGVNSEKTGVFVVDEPELSLHLSWQKIFIEKALKVNNKVQFIFATHSPEIVGKYRNKVKKLERENNK